MRQFHLHLVSDSTGDTVSSVARAVLVQFENIDVREHMWPLVRTKGQLDSVIEALTKEPGIVFYTVVNEELRTYLKSRCQKLGVPCVPVLSRAVAELSTFLGMKVSGLPGRQHEMDEEYFSKVEALNFTLSHDDGQGLWDIDEAEIIVVGVSRTSKSPTCVYLANRGFRAANIPFVYDIPLPEQLFHVKNTFIVGLTISPERLVQIRKSRLLSLNQEEETDYVALEMIRKELLAAKKIFRHHNWPVIDVSRRSVEETAATIIHYYQHKWR